MGFGYLGDTPEEWATKRLLPSDPIFISVSEVCQILGVSKGTVHAWIKAGLVPAVQVGGRNTIYRIPASWVVDICRQGMEYKDAQGL